MGGVRGKGAFVQHHGIFCWNLRTHSDVVSFRAKIVGEVIVLFIVQDQPDYIAIFQATRRNIQCYIPKFLIKLSCQPMVTIYTSVFHRAQEGTHIGNAGITAGNGKGDLGAVRR